MPDYDQPPCPVDGYLWQPGYWAWSVSAADYYWVPGVWVAPPHPGLLWTPGYWGFIGGIYRFHPGYWGATVGFYGGIHYGFGYFGVGFVGGEWHGGTFRYNTAVVHVNTTVVRNVYVNKTVINNTTVVNRTSFNGQGGVTARPTTEETVAMHQQHFRPTADQVAHQRAAVSNKSQFASVNKGAPATTSQEHITATPHNNPGNGQHNFNQRTSDNVRNPGQQRNLSQRMPNNAQGGQPHNNRGGGNRQPKPRGEGNKKQKN
ncbi:MAG: YXWGXW repeat-containing protein [Bacteroidetes bacterium]|nr:YXWGXW repeat-containing protein [Bacteroidota bacterium]